MKDLVRYFHQDPFEVWERETNERSSAQVWHQQSTSIRDAGQEFLVRLIRHFENDRPDVSELEDDEER
jgi:hypothetical protein